MRWLALDRSAEEAQARGIVRPRIERDGPLVEQFLRVAGGGIIVDGLILGALGVHPIDWPLLAAAVIALGLGAAVFSSLRLGRRIVIPFVVGAFGLAYAIGVVTSQPLATAAALSATALGLTVMLLDRRVIPIALVGVLGVTGALIWRHPDPWGERIAGLGLTLVGLIAMGVVLIAIRNHYSWLADARLRLIASVSHELRTPLTGVSGFTDLLLSKDSGLDASERREALLTIGREAADVAAVLDDLLVASRLAISDMPLSRMTVDVAAQARQVIDILTMSSERTIEMTTSETPRVTADPARVRQVIRNLLTNALKHGGPTVSVLVEASAVEGIVRVIDDGPGPSPEIEKMMFDAFVTGIVPEGRTDSFGLGLSISRQLARAMDGDLRYDRDGPQTSFALSLPLATD